MVEDGRISNAELDFSLELARPETRGGLVVVLEHPHRSQEYQHGYVHEERRCTTLAAVTDLIRTVSNGICSADNVSILDAMPFITEDFDGTEPHQTAQRAFVEAMKRKQPDVVISCFKTKTENTFISSLQSLGVGKQYSLARTRTEQDQHKFRKVNAFHPSYAMNYVPAESCFRRLLILEFTQAVTIMQEEWKDQEWMTSLRQCCAQKAKDHVHKKITPEQVLATSTQRFLAGLQELDLQLLKPAEDLTALLSVIVRSDVTWLACDIGLSLNINASTRGGAHAKTIMGIIRQLMSITTESGEKRVPNTDPAQRGYLKHDLLLRTPTKSVAPKTRNLLEVFATLSRQLNMLFRPAESPNKYRLDREKDIQANAFLRFARALEERMYQTSSMVNHNTSSEGIVHVCHNINSTDIAAGLQTFHIGNPQREYILIENSAQSMAIPRVIYDRAFEGPWALEGSAFGNAVV